MSSKSRSEGNHKYRVFISYSHADKELVSKIATILEDNGVKPMWDEKFDYGFGFHEQIRDFIAHAHVFLPVISATSDERRWVHQEIGFALAMNIPVLPVAVGRIPGEMLQHIHAIRFDDIEKLKGQLSRDVIANLVKRYLPIALAYYRCAELPEDRAKMMADYCNNVAKLNQHGMFRQKGALSSLHIPNKLSSHPAWRMRCGGEFRGDHHCNLQREERRAVELHATNAGCKLIVNPYRSL